MHFEEAQSKVNAVSYVQVVVDIRSHLIGKSIRELRFRTKYDAAIVAVQRRVSSAARVNCETRHFFLIPCSYANTHRMHYIPPAGRALETKDWRNCAERGGRAAARHRCVCLLQPLFLVHIFGSCIRAGFTVHLQSSGSHFLENYREDKAFALVSEVEKSSPPKTGKMWLGLGLLIAMIATQVRVSTNAVSCIVSE